MIKRNYEISSTLQTRPFTVLLGFLLTILLFMILSCNQTGTSQNKWMKQGDELISKFEYQNALQLYQGVLAKEPKNAEAMAAIGKVYMIFRKFDDAFDILEQAIQTDSTCLNAYLNLARAHTARGDWDEKDNKIAVIILLKAYDRYPKNIPLILEMSRCYGLCFDYTSAVEMARRAKEIAPNDTNVQKQYESILYWQEKNRNNIFAR